MVDNWTLPSDSISSTGTSGTTYTPGSGEGEGTATVSAVHVLRTVCIKIANSYL